jgi:23S rRNA pseudouridine1911/1915/1917 synthase
MNDAPTPDDDEEGADLEHYAKKWQRVFAKIVRKNKEFDHYDSEINHNDQELLGGTIVTLMIGAEQAGARLDAALAVAQTALSRARLQALIAQGHLSHEGMVITNGKQKARVGAYQLFVPDPVAAEPEPQDLALEVLYEDAHLIVVNKPAGMAAHPAAGTPDKTLVNALLFHCGDSLSGIGGVLRPGIVHRLDKDTSGVMVAAKTDAAHHGLSALFAKHDIERIYIAFVRKGPQAAAGTVTTRLGRSHHDRKKMAVVRESGREAITHYQVVARFGDVASKIACRLETGRTLQIRVHMAHFGCPCLGDPVYGSGAAPKGAVTLLADLGFGRQALHAAVLGFVHPITGDKLRFETPLPADMTALEAALGGLF